MSKKRIDWNGMACYSIGKVIVLCSIFSFCIIFIAGCSDRNKTSYTWPTDDTMIRLYQHETGDVVEIRLADYLCGVLAGEMDNTWPEEALKAQAILARTFTL